jgi:hypothetical protein
MTSAAQALKDVLAGAGCTLPHRDSVDQRIVHEVTTGTGSLIDSQAEVGGWPEYRSARPPLDTDLDGIPDEWEIAHKLNPNDPTDAAAGDSTGYTNIEIYLNSLVLKPVPAR